MKKILSIILVMLLAFSASPAFAENETIVTVESADAVDISKPVAANVTVGSGFEKATFSIGEDLVYTLEGDGSLEYNIELDLSHTTFLGEACLKVVAKYESKTENIEIDLNLIKFSDEKTIFFDSGSHSNYTSTSNGNGKFSTITEDDGNTYFNINVLSNTGSAPYSQKSSLGIQPGAHIVFAFDVMADALTTNISLEMRDQNTANSRYPINGKSNMQSMNVFNGGKISYTDEEFESGVWYNFKYEINTVTKGMDVYAKKSSDEEYTLIKSFPEYKSQGLHQVRFVATTSSADGGNASFDNVSVSEVRLLDKVWFVKERSFANGKLDIVFSKDMAIEDGDIKIYNSNDDFITSTGSYDSETFTYTCEFEKPLLFENKYAISFDDSILAADGSEGLIYEEQYFVTTAYSIDVVSCEKSSSSLVINLQDEGADGEIMMVCQMNGDACVGVNFVSIVDDKGEYNVAISNVVSEDTIIYILDKNFITKKVYSFK